MRVYALQNIIPLTGCDVNLFLVVRCPILLKWTETNATYCARWRIDGEEEADPVVGVSQNIYFSLYSKELVL